MIIFKIDLIIIIFIMEKINKMDINKIEEKYYRNITNNDISQKNILKM